MSLQKLFADNRGKPRRIEIVGAAKDEAEIWLYDAIGGWDGIEAGQFVKDLRAIKAATIHLRINSPGGDVFAARAIATALREHSARVVAHVDGLAASAASFIMLAADERVMSEGAFVMIHNPWAITIGDAATHSSTVALLEKIGDSMAADYAKASGKSLDEAKAWMDAETWFTAAEAKDAGLVDGIVEVAAPKNEWDLSAYSHTPATLRAGQAAAMAQSAPTAEVQGSAPDKSNKEIQMDNPAVTTGQTVPPNQDAVNAAVQAETHRCSEINRIGIAAKMPADAIQAAITGKVTVEAYKDQVLNAMVAASQTNDTRVGSVAATIPRDETDTRRGLMVSAIMARVNAKFAVDSSNDFRGMSCLRMAEEVLVRSGHSVRGKTPNEIAIMAMQQTSDFPLVMETSARKLLLAAYELAVPTYRTWAKQSTTPDFKTMSRTRLGEAPKFLKVPEGAQITISTMTESREQYAIATYGRGISFTRQMLINDDLGAFDDMIRAFGMQASILENKTVYAILTANAAMADGVTLFHANHGNSGAGAIGNTGLDAMFTAMRVQKGLDAASILNIKPKFLIVPAAKEATGKAAMKETGPNLKAADSNMFANTVTVVADGELDATSTVQWYGAADPAIYPGIEYSHLEGANGPQMLREENGSGILGVNLYAFLDFGAKAVDWRALYYSTGQ